MFHMAVIDESLMSIMKDWAVVQNANYILKTGIG